MSGGRVTVHGWKQDNLLHIEVEGCVINVRTGLSERRYGRKVTSVEIIPDEDYYEPGWLLSGSRNNRLIQRKKMKPRRIHKCPMPNCTEN